MISEVQIYGIKMQDSGRKCHITVINSGFRHNQARGADVYRTIYFLKLGQYLYLSNRN